MEQVDMFWCFAVGLAIGWFGRICWSWWQDYEARRWMVNIMSDIRKASDELKEARRNHEQA